jgi:hypothetical protein
MREIRPVHLHESGARVVNLHQGLRFLIRNQPGISDNDRESFQQQLASDRTARTFGHATAHQVGIWQKQLKFRPDLPQDLKDRLNNLPISTFTEMGNGDVDELTAEALNWLLRKLGAFISPG